MSICKYLFFSLGLFVCLSMHAASLAKPIAVEVDADRVVKENRPGFASTNLCWLTDSDKHWRRPIPMSRALHGLGVGALRFPYGHLADYYIWHDGPYQDLERRGLNPRMAGMPGYLEDWTWAFHPDGTFKGAMDFDEYIALCKRLDAKPMVVVNTLSMYTDDKIDREQLIRSAAEWVRYAKTKDYPVAYWSIGNEVDHGPSRRYMSRQDYFELYTDMVRAMKEVDPTIRTGPGILGNGDYYRQALSLEPGLVDFLCVHQYMFFYSSDNADKMWQDNPLKAWQNTDDFRGYGIVRMAQRVMQQHKTDGIELLVTETGITGSPDAAGKENNLWKALWWLEVLMYQAHMPDVSYSFYWGSHSPWYGNTEDDIAGKDQGVLLRLDDNRRKPTGDIVHLFNRYFFNQVLEVERVHGTVRVFASRDSTTGKLSIFLLNKGDTDQTINLKVTGGEPLSWLNLRYSGQDAVDNSPRRTAHGRLRHQDTISVTCPAMSLTILRQ